MVSYCYGMNMYSIESGGEIQCLFQLQKGLLARMDCMHNDSNSALDLHSNVIDSLLKL